EPCRHTSAGCDGKLCPEWGWQQRTRTIQVHPALALQGPPTETILGHARRRADGNRSSLQASLSSHCLRWTPCSIDGEAAWRCISFPLSSERSSEAAANRDERHPHSL